MPRCKSAILAAALVGAIVIPLQTYAADVMCNNLVPGGAKMICPGFEPNWAVEFPCNGPVMTSKARSWPRTRSRASSPTWPTAGAAARGA